MAAPFLMRRVRIVARLTAVRIGDHQLLEGTRAPGINVPALLALHQYGVKLPHRFLALKMHFLFVRNRLRDKESSSIYDRCVYNHAQHQPALCRESDKSTLIMKVNAS